MKAYAPNVSMALCFTLSLLSVNPGYAAKQKEVGFMTPMKYEGGSLPLNQHDKLETSVNTKWSWCKGTSPDTGTDSADDLHGTVWRERRRGAILRRAGHHH